jgi:hypothetical protein
MFKAYYIQTFGGIIANENCFTAFEGASKERFFSQDEVKPPTKLFEEVEEIPVRKDVLVVGFIQDTLKHFERLGINIPAPIHIPEELIPFTKRNIQYMNYKEFKERDLRMPVFIKSFTHHKVFDSGVIKLVSSKSDPTIFKNEVTDETPVLVSDYVDMSSEYRVFVRNGRMVGMRHYNGDFTHG